MVTKASKASPLAAPRSAPHAVIRAPRPELRAAASSTVLILAGGPGRPLQPGHGSRQKVLAEVHGKPFLSYLLEQVEAAGYRSVVLCTGFCAKDIRQHYGETFGGVQLRYSVEEVPQGTGGALRWGAELADTERVLAMNGDSYCDVDLRAFDRWAAARHEDAALVATEKEDTSRFDVLDLDEERVVGYRDRVAGGGFGWVSAGIYSFRRSFLTSLPRCGPFSLEHDIFERQLRGSVVAYRHSGRFLDIRTPKSLANAEGLLQQEF